MQKKREIELKEQVDFFITCCSQFKIKLEPSQVADVVSIIHRCYEDDMMFDSWFRGVDVMN